MEDLEPGWLIRQMNATLEEMENWPSWMLLELKTRQEEDRKNHEIRPSIKNL